LFLSFPSFFPATIFESPPFRKVKTMTNLPLASLRQDGQRTKVQIGDVRIGEGFAVIAGPCTVENEEQIFQTARNVRRAGAALLRGGAFKPRTSPYAFQGLGYRGLKMLRAAGDAVGLPIITEVMDTRDVEPMAEIADVLQIGTRNMQNYTLLKEVGKVRRPVLLKRGLYATIDEWLCAAEYILAEGNSNVILCERGIRTFERATRNTLDLSAVALVRLRSHLPVIVDPSHATGIRELVEPMSLAAMAAGADGVMVEVQTCPKDAICDGHQSLDPAQFDRLMSKVNGMSRWIHGSHPICPPPQDAMSVS
jgi:3-deoxy-7-phosphoheptulonate synthase